LGSRFLILAPFGPQTLIGGADLTGDIAGHLRGQAELTAHIGVRFLLKPDAIAGFAMRKRVDTHSHSRPPDRPVAFGARAGTGQARWSASVWRSILVSSRRVYTMKEQKSRGGGRFLPMSEDLSFIHNLQTELSAEMNALQQHLDTQPASPQGFPAR